MFWLVKHLHLCSLIINCAKMTSSFIVCKNSSFRYSTSKTVADKKFSSTSTVQDISSDASSCRYVTAPSKSRATEAKRQCTNETAIYQEPIIGRASSLKNFGDSDCYIANDKGYENHIYESIKPLQLSRKRKVRRHSCYRVYIILDFNRA